MGDIFYCNNPDNCLELIIASVSALATVASAVIMCCTFRHQQKTYAEVQFKTAFYSILNNHRKLTDDLKVKVTMLNNDILEESKAYVARQCFGFAQKEVAKIIDVLSQKKYLGILEDNDRQRIAYWESEEETYFNESEERKKCDMEIDKAILEYRRKYYITTYRISKEHYNKSREFSDKTICAFKIFLKSWQICYEHYIRNFQQLLLYVQSQMPKRLSRNAYLNSIAYQMAREELWFINLYAQIDGAFKESYLSSGMDKIVKEQLTNPINLIEL